ncbi:MAG: nucleotidyltransferase family protein, partial [Nitrospiraceae bacterium]
KHLWQRLEWITSVAEVLRTHGRMDWRQVVDIAHALGSERMVLLGLALARDFLGADLPDAIMHMMGSDPVIEVLERLVQERLFLGDREQENVFESALFHLKARERLRDKVRYCLRLAMTTTVRDWTAARFPPVLALLYYPVRAIRLTGKYGPEVLKRYFALY